MGNTNTLCKCDETLKLSSMRSYIRAINIKRLQKSRLRNKIKGRRMKWRRIADMYFFQIDVSS